MQTTNAVGQYNWDASSGSGQKGVITTWVLFAIRIEESTLVEVHGERYEGYRHRVPALLPRFRSWT